jgi:hypothetical protein
MRKTLVRTGLLAVLATFGMAVPAHAAVAIRVTQPFSQPQVNPCNGEPVQLDGTVTVLFTVTQPASGGLNLFSNVRFDLTGVGAFGNVYTSKSVINAPAHLGFAVGGDGPFVNQETSETELISRGGAPNFLARFVLHENFFPDGTVTADIFLLSTVCRG